MCSRFWAFIDGPKIEKNRCVRFFCYVCRRSKIRKNVDSVLVQSGSGSDRFQFTAVPVQNLPVRTGSVRFAAILPTSHQLEQQQLHHTAPSPEPSTVAELTRSHQKSRFHDLRATW